MSRLKKLSGGSAAAVFFFIFTIALGSRLYLARNVKTCLDGDESVSCVLAYHIESRGERPVFPYGIRYNGAGAVEAYFAAALNYLRGREMFNALAVPAAEFAVFAALSSVLAARAGGPFLGLLLGLHLVFSPQFYRASLRISGYCLTLAAMALLANFVMAEMMGSDDAETGGAPPGLIPGAVAGLIAGVALWFHEFSAVMTAALFIAVAFRWRAKAAPALLAWVFAFPLGAAPVVLSYLETGFGGMHQGAVKLAVASQTQPGPWWSFFTNELPSFFKNENWGSFTPGVPWSAWLLFAATLLGCAAAALPRDASSRAGRNWQIPKFTAFYSLLFISIYIISPYRGDTPRRLLSLEPFMSITACAGIMALLLRRGAAPKIAASVLIAAFIIADVNGAAFALRDDTVWDGNKDVSCKRAGDMIAALEERNIRRVYTSSFLKWMVLCGTEEKIVAADVGMTRGGPGRDQWSEHEETMSAIESPAYVFNAKDQRLPWLIAYLREHRTPMRLLDTGEYVLIVPAGPAPRDDFMDWSFKMQRLRQNAR